MRDKDYQPREERHKEFKRRARRINERTPLGLILLVVGGVLLARQMGVLLPPSLFTWQALLIGIGIIIGIANSFRDLGWLVVVAVGVFFLMDDFYPGMGRYAWPSLIIFLGLIIILKPRRKKNLPFIDQQPQSPEYITAGDTTSEDALDAVAVFGAVKKMVLSKNFRGGDVVAVFGGAEINLSQADFQSPIKLDIVAVFGGVKLIVPANWEVRSEATAILGGVDDKRGVVASHTPEKVIILDGTAMCGGIEISSY